MTPNPIIPLETQKQDYVSCFATIRYRVNSIHQPACPVTNGAGTGSNHTSQRQV